MPSASPIILFDGVDNYTYNPREVATPKSVFRYDAGSIAAGDSTLVSQWDPTKGPSRPTYKVTHRLNQPLILTCEGECPPERVDDTLRFIGEWVLPENTTAAERAIFHTLVASMIGHADLKAGVVDLDPIY